MSNNKCQKFLPNIFDKNKCQACLRAKDKHSAEALKCGEIPRKVSKCSWLFVAPEILDFSKTFDQSKRWQRRFFVLYDDGELTYSLDDSIHTVPQGTIDMNQVTEVYDGEESTTHQFSIVMVTPDKSTYIKGTTKDEITRWFDVLVMYPRSKKMKHRRSPTYQNRSEDKSDSDMSEVRRQKSVPARPTCNGVVEGAPIKRQRFHSAPRVVFTEADKENQADAMDTDDRSLDERRSARGRSSSTPGLSENVRPVSEHTITYRGIRSLKHKNDKAYQEGMRKSNSLHDLPTSSTIEEEERNLVDTKLRSRSRESLPDSARAVSGAFGEWLYANNTDRSRTSRRCLYENTDRKTLCHSLLTEPAAPVPMSRARQYRKLANLPITRTIDDYVGHLVESASRPRRHKSPGRPRDLDFVNTNRVANTARFWESQSSEASQREASSIRNGPSVHASQPVPPTCTSHPSSMRVNTFSSSLKDASSYSRRHASPSSQRAKPLRRSLTPGPDCFGQDSRRQRSPSPGRRRVASPSPSMRRTEAERQRRRGEERSSYRSRSPTSSLLLTQRSKNETDEHKMARSGDLAARLGGQLSRENSPGVRASPVRSTEESLNDELTFVKKGWLVKQGTTERDWSKHWFVLSGTNLKYYKDSKAEELNVADGVIDLSACREIYEITVSRNYGFKIRISSNEYVLSAMTSGIRQSWMEAIQKCVETGGKPNSPSTSDSASPWLNKSTLNSSEASSEGTNRSKSRTPESRLTNTSQSNGYGSGGALSARRRLPLDSISKTTEVKSEEPKISCTWPFTKTEPTTPTEKPQTPRVSQVKDYLDSEEEKKCKKAFSPEEEQELDNVERNIRRIHRRSITEFVLQHKPQHLDKFEDGSAFRDKSQEREPGSEAYRRPRSSTSGSVDVDSTPPRSRRSKTWTSSDSSYTSSRSPSREKSLSPARRKTEVVDRGKVPMPYRAPSAKIKDKSRAKSPRPKSPPLQLKDMDSYDEVKQDILRTHLKSNMVESRSSNASSLTTSTLSSSDLNTRSRPSRQHTATAIAKPTTDTRSDISQTIQGGIDSSGPKTDIPATRVHKEDTILTPPPRTKRKSANKHKSDVTDKVKVEAVVKTSPPRVEDNTMEELLELEVESLKRQLQKQESEKEQLRESNHDLKAQLRAWRRDHRDSLDDMQTDQGRFMTQIADMQDEMENTTKYLKSQLNEQSESTRQEMATLNEKLQAAEATINKQQDDMIRLQAKLEVSESELNCSNSALKKSVCKLEREKDRMQQLTTDYDIKVQSMEQDVLERDKELQDKDDEVDSYLEKIKKLDEMLQENNAHFETSEANVQELASVRKELRDETDRNAVLKQELEISKQQLRGQDEEMQALHRDSSQKIKLMEDEFYREKDVIQKQLTQLRQQYDQQLKQSNISDSLTSNMTDILREKDETIAQLEEKVIEDENHIEELNDQLQLMVEGKAQLQQNVGETCSQNTKLKQDVDDLNAKHKQLEAESVQIRNSNNELSNKNFEKDKDLANRNKELERLRSTLQEVEQESERAKELAEEYRKEVEYWKKKYEDKVEEFIKLEKTTQTYKSENDQIKAQCQILQNDLKSANENISKLQMYSNKQRNGENELAEKYKELSENYQKMIKELENANKKAQSFESNVEIQRRKNVKELEEKVTKISEMQKLVDKLQQQLKQAETGSSVSVDSSQNMPSLSLADLPKDYSTMKSVYLKTSQQYKALQQESQQRSMKIERLESLNDSLKVDMKNMEIQYHDQLNQMGSKLQTKTAKLAAADRRLQRLDRRSSKKEVSLLLDETDLCEDLNSSASSTCSSPRDTGGQDTELEVKLTAVECQLALSQEKVKSLNKELHEQRNLEVEIRTLKSKEQTLVEQNQQNLQNIKQLQDQVYALNENKKLDVSGHLQELLNDLKTKVLHFNSSDIDTVDTLKHRLEHILRESSRAEVTLSSGYVSVNQTTEVEKMGLFAEKLAIEAILLKEMASIINNKLDTEVDSENEQHMNEMKVLRSKMLQLGALVHRLKTGQTLTKYSALKEGCLQKHVSLLAKKMELLGQLNFCIEQWKNESDFSGKSSLGEIEITDVGREALRRAKLKQELHSYSLPYTHSSNICDSTSSLATKVLVNSEVDFIYSELDKQLSSATSKGERASMLCLEQQCALESLLRQDKELTSQVDSYCKCLCGSLNKLTMSKETDFGVKSVTDQAERDLPVLINRFVELYTKDMLNDCDSSIDQEKRRSLLQSHVRAETDGVVQKMHLHLRQGCQSSELQLHLSPDLDDQAKISELLMSLAEVTAHKSMISSELTFISEQLQQKRQDLSAELSSDGQNLSLKRQDSGIIVHVSAPSLGECSYVTADSLEAEASVRANLATHLINNTANIVSNSGNLKSRIANLAAHLADIDCNLLPFHRTAHAHQDFVSQEAVIDAQLTYLCHVMRVRHQHELEQLRLAFTTKENETKKHLEQQVNELCEEVEHLTEIINQKEAAIQNVSEQTNIAASELERLCQEKDNEYRENIEHMKNSYESKVRVLQNELEVVRSNFTQQRGNLEHKQKRYAQELHALKDSFEIPLQSLQNDLEVAKTELDKSKHEKESEISNLEKTIFTLQNELQTCHHSNQILQKEKDDKVGYYEAKIDSLQQKLDEVRGEHDRELDQAQDDLKTAMKAVNTQSNAKLETEISRLQTQLEEERSRHLSDIESLREDISGDADAAVEHVMNSKVQELERQIQIMQSDYEEELAVQKAAHRRELARSKDDMMQLLAEAEAKSIHIDEDVIRKKYIKDIERIKEMYDRGFAAMEKSHQKVLNEMRKAHKRELDTLRQEKDQLLAEETKATQAALDAMKKAQEAELQKERNKFLDVIAKTYSNADIDSLQLQHEEDLVVINDEMQLLSEQFAIKCVENAALEERLEVQTKALHESRKRVQDLIGRNEELTTRLRFEIEKLKRSVDKDGSLTTPYMKQGDSPEVYDLKVAIKVRDAEAVQLKDQIDNLKEQLQDTVEELEESMEMCTDLQEENQKFKVEHEKEMEEERRQSSDIDASLSLNLDSPHEAEDSSGDKEGNVSGVTPSVPRRERPALPDLTLTTTVLDKSRPLPQVSPEARNVKKTLWRQKQPQRALSTPGLGGKGFSMNRKLSVDEACMGRTSPRRPSPCRSPYSDDVVAD